MGKADVVKGMIIDGIVGSEAIDSSGEILDVAGCDISTLENGEGVLNFEHKNAKAPGASFNDTIGRCIFAKKIFKRDDCSNDRERMFWDKVELPFVYGKFELFDAEGHPNAVAAAAIIRHYARRKLPAIIRFSIEGNTLHHDKSTNRLMRTLARAVAATIKPANKSAVSGLVEDPLGDGETLESKDPLEDLAETKKFEHPDKRRLSSYEMEYDPILSDPQGDESEELAKALTAGGAGAAPGSLTGGAALAKEDFLKSPDAKKKLVGVVKSFPGGSKEEFKRFIKTKMPEADDSYIEYFTDLVDDIQVKKSQQLDVTLEKAVKLVPEGSKPVAGWRRDSDQDYYERPQKKSLSSKDRPLGPDGKPLPPSAQLPPLSYNPTPAEEVTGPAYGDGKSMIIGPNGPAGTYFDPAESPQAAYEAGSSGRKYPNTKPVAITAQGKPVEPNVGMQNRDTKLSRGYVVVPEGNVRLNFMDRVGDRESLSTFNRIINDEDYIKPWREAMVNWVHLHNLARNGKVPTALIAHGAMFSMLSPNTPVPTQELMYSHLIDAMNHTGLIPENKNFGDIREQYRQTDQPDRVPFASRDVWEGPEGDAVRLKTDSNEVVRRDNSTGEYIYKPSRNKGDMGGFMLFDNKMDNMAKYHALHDHLVGTVSHHVNEALKAGTTPDGRAMAEDMMEWKRQGKAWANRGSRSFDNWRLDPAGPQDDSNPQLPVVKGLAPKTTRYMLGMLGFGNMVVPDTHFVRHLFGLKPSTDSTAIDRMKEHLWMPENNRLMHSIDKAYMAKHPAFQKVLKDPMFDGIDPEHRLFPAFWLHWIAIPEHERAMGYGTQEANNENTSHAAYWDAVHKILVKHNLPGLPSSRYAKSEDYVADLKKAFDESKERPLPLRTALAMHEIVDTVGHTAALLAYHRVIAPLLCAHDELRKSEERIQKIVQLTGTLAKSAEDHLLPPIPQAIPPVGSKFFFGRHVAPGEVEFIGGPNEGARIPMYGRDEQFVYVGDDSIKKIRVDHENKAYRVNREPVELNVPVRVDSAEHIVPGFADDTESRLLVHGLDLGIKSEGYRRSGGRIVYVQKVKDPETFSSALRSCAFYKTANDIFGIGEYVPKATLFIHPATREKYAVQEVIPDGAHIETRSMGSLPKRGTSTVRKLERMGDGTLDRLAIVDYILGVPNRGPHGYVITDRLHLIDNGLAFTSPKGLPDYVTRYNSICETGPVAPAVHEWIQNINTEQLAATLLHLSVPPETIRETVARALLVKRLEAELPDLSLQDVYRERS